MPQKIVRSLEEVRPLLSQSRFLLVHGKAFEHLGLRPFFDSMEHAEFTDFTPNPLYEQVYRGIAKFTEEGCSMIVAVGGGSAIDVAKCIKLFCKMDPARNYLTQPFVDSDIPLLAIPTTAGTGSESTQHAVLYYQGVKQSISHASLVPDCTVLLPELLASLPLYQKKCTLMDALCQAIESWWSVNSTPSSRELSREAVASITANWEAYLLRDESSAAETIMLASNLAGQAINITATTAAHAMSYKITSLYGFPHGHAVAVCLPHVWDYLLTHSESCIDPRGPQYLRDTLADIAALISPRDFRNMLNRLELHNPLSSQKEPDVLELVRSVNPVRLKNTPVHLDEAALKFMYQEIVQQ